MAAKHLLVQSYHHSLVSISPLEPNRGHSDFAMLTLDQYMINFGRQRDAADKLL